MTVEATSAAGAVVNFSPTATDNVDPSVTVNGTPASGSTFPIGTTLVTANASDIAGNAAIPVNFNVIVNPFTPPPVPDTTPPIITLNGADPINLILEIHTQNLGQPGLMILMAQDRLS